jgi:hypothetical protein
MTPVKFVIFSALGILQIILDIFLLYCLIVLIGYFFFRGDDAEASGEQVTLNAVHLDRGRILGAGNIDHSEC